MRQLLDTPKFEKLRLRADGRNVDGSMYVMSPRVDKALGTIANSIFSCETEEKRVAVRLEGMEKVAGKAGEKEYFAVSFSYVGRHPYSGWSASLEKTMESLGIVVDRAERKIAASKKMHFVTVKIPARTGEVVTGRVFAPQE